MSPTGREQSSQRGGSASLSAASSAIQSAIQADQSLASEDVRVQQTGNRIMLQGKVSSEQVKTRIETMAKEAAAGVEIDNKLKVEKR
jgi:osmotically-inducible protein OsmY